MVLRKSPLALLLQLAALASSCQYDMNSGTQNKRGDTLLLNTIRLVGQHL